VQAGWLFAPMPGSKADGARFVPEAIAGARRDSRRAGHGDRRAGAVTLLRAAEPRHALARWPARFSTRRSPAHRRRHRHQRQDLGADFTRRSSPASGARAASLGTIGLVKPDGSVYGGLTTPDPVTCIGPWRSWRREGVTHLAFEASSHGLDQHRLDGVRLKAAAFTNLGRDHLDYHPSMERYLQPSCASSPSCCRRRRRRRQCRRRARPR
jgi:UDP-N-acetylmuramoyl-L-alanyl-D-glutamate--2,6-diaminopimelate ligase